MAVSHGSHGGGHGRQSWAANHAAAAVIAGVDSYIAACTAWIAHPGLLLWILHCLLWLISTEASSSRLVGDPLADLLLALLLPLAAIAMILLLLLWLMVLGRALCTLSGARSRRHRGHTNGARHHPGTRKAAVPTNVAAAVSAIAAGVNRSDCRTHAVAPREVLGGRVGGLSGRERRKLLLLRQRRWQLSVSVFLVTVALGIIAVCVCLGGTAIVGVALLRWHCLHGIV